MQVTVYEPSNSPLCCSFLNYISFDIDASSRPPSALTIAGPAFNEILTDYIRQGEEDPTYRKARLKAAKRMLGI